MSRNRGVDALLGVGYVFLAAALIAVAMLAYNRTFVSSVDVELTTASVGNALQKGSDVKLNGVPVGVVSEVEPADDGAVVKLALNPETSEKLPRDTTARLLPKTLFGERYVSLVTPSGEGEGLSNGDTIHQDDSDAAVELEEVFDELLPLLQSIQPEKLSAMLGEVSTLLRGRGDDIGDTFVESAEYLEQLNPLVPTMTEDLAKFGRVAGVYADAAPDLLNALQSLTTTSRTMVDQRSQLADVYASVITSADTSTGWVSDNQDTIEVLSEESRAALEAAKPYAKQFPCLFESTRKYIPVMDKTLGKGTDEEGLHVQLNIVKSRGKYLPGKDAPVFSTGGKARCPYVTGNTGTKPASASASSASGDAAPEQIRAPRTSLPSQIGNGAGLGQANSPAENQLVAELVAPTQGMAPADYPKWSSLLVGPTLRNTKVVLR